MQDSALGARLGDAPLGTVGVSYAETTAALTVMRAMVTDLVLAARIGRELTNRRQPMPDWLEGLEQIELDGDVWLMTHVLGDGGWAPQRVEWSVADTKALTDDFFSSSDAAGLDHPDERELMGSILWFGTDYGPREPLRWSPVNVEMLLVDWVPRKILAEVPFLAKLPDLLRAFIRYCHARRGIRSELTDETLAAVDHWEPEYQRLIRSDRPQGPAALLADLLPPPDDEDVSFSESCSKAWTAR